MLQKRALDSRDAFAQGLAYSSSAKGGGLRILAPLSTPSSHKKSTGGLKRQKWQRSRQSAPRIVNADGVAVGTFVAPPTCKADAVENYAFTRLRFFDTCASFSMLKKGKLWQAVTAPFTSNASKAASHERAFLNQLFAPEFTGVSCVCGTGRGNHGICAVMQYHPVSICNLHRHHCASWRLVFNGASES